MTMMIMMIIITFCALDILILEFLTCKWQLVWNMLIKFHILLAKLKKKNSNMHYAYVRKPSYGGGTSHIHAAGVHHYRWHGT